MIAVRRNLVGVEGSGHAHDNRGDRDRRDRAAWHGVVNVVVVRSLAVQKSGWSAIDCGRMMYAV